MVVPPQDAAGFVQNGDLHLSFGNFSRTLQDCLLDKVRPVINDEGFMDWRLELMDRRWRWRKTGKLSGRYNVRRSSVDIVPETKKKLIDLAVLCTKAMNEGDANLAPLKTIDAFPEVDWDYVNPAAALEDLCNSVGCRVGLGANDVLTVFRVGSGRQLPGNAMEGELTFDPPDLPGKLVIVGARHKLQFDAELEAVGLDLDQKIKPIDKLSYIPTWFGHKTWAFSDAEHFNDVTDIKARKLAQQTVWKWYRIKVPLKLAKLPAPVNNLDDVLPLNDYQVFQHKVGDRVEPMPVQVYGSWWEGTEAHKPEVDPATVKRKLDGSAEGQYYQGFNLDTKTGIVKFSNATYLHQRITGPLPDGTPILAGHMVVEARLFLKGCCGIRNKDTRGWYRGEFTRAWRINGRPVRRRGAEESVEYRIREDLEYAAWKDWAAGGVERDNKAAFDQVGEEYFTSVEREYTQTDSGSGTYRGWIPIESDGAIQQISYILTEAGFAVTRVSRNREEMHIAASYKERRLVEKILADEAKWRERFLEELAAKRA